MLLGFIHDKWPEDFPPFEKVLVILRSMEKAGLVELYEMSPYWQAQVGQNHCWTWGNRVQEDYEYARGLGIRAGDSLFEYAARFVNE